MDHAGIHKHVAWTHDAEIRRVTQTTYEHLLSQLEQEPETLQIISPVDISAWIPDISHISEEELKRDGHVLIF